MPFDLDFTNFWFEIHHNLKNHEKSSFVEKYAFQQKLSKSSKTLLFVNGMQNISLGKKY